MDLRFTAEEEAFRKDVRRFIRENLDPVTHRKMVEGRIPDRAEVVAWQQTLNGQGWATPSWPKSHGGPGFTPVERYIFLDELHQAPAPEPVSFNVSMIGPVLIQYGTPAQQERFLAATANLDVWWAQGFSEPGATGRLAEPVMPIRSDEMSCGEGLSTRVWNRAGGPGRTVIRSRSIRAVSASEFSSATG